MKSSSLKIAHVSSTFPPYAGGTGNVAYHLCRGLAQSGYQVSLFTTIQEGAASRETLDGISIHRLNPFFRSGNSAFLPQLAWRLRGFDLIHLHYPFLGGETCTLAALLSGTPLVVSYQMDLVVRGRKIAVEKIHRATLGRLTLRLAARVLYSSEDYALHSTSRALLAGRSERVGYLPNGVDVQAFCPAPASPQLASLYRSDPSERILLLVATLDRAHYFKGVEVFLEALAGLPAHIKGIVVGEGDMRPYYMELAGSLGIASGGLSGNGIPGRVFFPGRVPEEILPEYYRLADLSVLPSTTMGEAFGLVLVEALACGTPVIASNLPGVRTVVSDGVDGFLVKAGDAGDLRDKVAAFVDLPGERRQEMGAAGRRKTVELYDWGKVVQKLEGIYAQVLAYHR